MGRENPVNGYGYALAADRAGYDDGQNATVASSGRKALVRGLSA